MAERTSMPQPARSTWRRADTWAFIAIVAFAGLFRLIGLTVPGELVFDERFYAQDACWYLYHSEAKCEHRAEVSNEHPPLGKWMIVAGITLLGYRPLGWRAAPWIMGTLSVALLYLLARRLLRSTAGAAIAAGLLAVDFLHFVHSRLAMLDIFVTTSGLAAFLFCLYDRDARARGIWRPWRIAAGAAAGAAVASKVPGLYALMGVVALAIWWETRRAPAGNRARRVVAAMPSMLIAFVVVPGFVYTLSHIGWVQGRVFALPWEHGSWVRAFAARQWFMVRFHTGSFVQNAWQSPAWSWLLLRRPVPYFYGFKESGDRLREVLALGNPLVWWSSIPAIGAAAVHWIRRRGDAEAVIVLGFAVNYLPWLLFDRVRTFVFLFYLLPAVPFLCLAVARVGIAAMVRPWGKVASAAFAAGTLALLAFYYPLLTARPLTYEAWIARVGVFTNCGAPGTAGGGKLEGTRRLPAPRPWPPPPGWCWI
jgi:dolichyl-phosphate-mannose-protein mannosyltransferase